MTDSHLPGGAGMPDAWQRLWAPHRMSYLDGENRPLPAAMMSNVLLQNS
jgi:ATP adenylyltransferase